MTINANAEEVKDLAFFLDRLSGEDSWLAPLADERAFMASSNQPVFRRDCNAFLRTETEDGIEWKVLVDLAGPGVISRFWTAGDFDGELQIIIDSTTVVSTTLREFFGGECAPFSSPLVLDHTESSGGRVSYFPIPFAESIKIRSGSDSNSFYWQINYSLYGDSKVRSFNPVLSQKQRTALKHVSGRFSDFHSYAQAGQALKNFHIVDFNSGDRTVQKVDGKGIVRTIEFSMTPENWNHAHDLRFLLNYDGAGKPAVETGLPDLIHLGSKLREYESLYSSFDGTTASFKMPIPFNSGMEIILVNTGDYTFDTISIRLSVDTLLQSQMRFHAKTSREKPEFGKLMTIADIKGSGVFAGFNLITHAPTSVGDTYFNQEGNEYITLDDGKTTVWRGTGTEDYFNCGYYYRNGEAALPLHGCLDKRPVDGGIISAYRIQKLDAVPFRDGILVSLEPGCPKKGMDKIGKIVLDYRWTCFWYSKANEL